MPLTFRLAATLVVGWVVTGPATAQTCDFTISDMAFGNVDGIGGGAVDTTATVGIDCTGVALTSVRICPNINEGSGGADAAARYMSGPGGATLAYQLYQDAARTVVWGSAYWGLPGDPPTVVLPLGGAGSASTSLTLYGRVFAGQNAAPAGIYTSSFAGGETVFDYGPEVLGLVDCGDLPILQDTASPAFTVTASEVETCIVDAQDLGFGTHGVLTANVDANGQVTVTCTPSTAYTVELGNGLAGTGPTSRLMTNGPETITYGLYRDAARTEPWGDSATPGSEASGTGNGVAQDFTVYGRVPAQATPGPGTYTDTVVVTLTY